VLDQLQMFFQKTGSGLLAGLILGYLAHFSLDQLVRQSQQLLILGIAIGLLSYGTADLLGGEGIGFHQKSAELEAFAGGVKKGGRDANLSLLADERLDQGEVVFEKDRLHGVEQRVERHVLGGKVSLNDFVGLDVVELGESGD